jgi:hypothetical protein
MSDNLLHKKGPVATQLERIEQGLNAIRNSLVVRGEPSALDPCGLGTPLGIAIERLEQAQDLLCERLDGLAKDANERFLALVDMIGKLGCEVAAAKKPAKRRKP